MTNFRDFRRRCAQIVSSLVCSSLIVATANAAIVVNPALPITRRVEVQIIQTALDSGAQPATLLGNATQKADILASIDQIWAQAGIDVDFLPTTNRFNDTFALQGNWPTRPQSDLSQIIADAITAGNVLNSDSQVINMFFVDVTPGFGQLNESYVTGVARIGDNGVAQFIGENLLNISAGRDAIANVVAHEVGHNLGLQHVAAGTANLMSDNGTTEQLTTAQVATVWSSSFLQDLPPSPADLNGDGWVDGQDATLWQSAFGNNSQGDVDGDGASDGADFLLLQQQWTGGPAGVATTVALPEPSSLFLLSVALGLANSKRGRKSG